jgi:hypothetical protein
MGFVLLLAASFLTAQTRTGTLTGTVVDEQGEVLPGAEVTISSPQLIAPSLSRVANENGFVRFPYVPPGIYTMRVSLPGFAPLAMENIEVKLGLATDVELKLSATRIQEEVTVVSQAPIMSVENTKLATNVSAEEIRLLPVGRSLYTVMELAPGMLGSSAMGGGSRENTFAIDGVSVTDPGSGSGLGASQSLEAYEEVQVEMGGHAAEHGNAGGAIINVITKSGGNNFSGEVSLFFDNDKLQSSNHEGTGLSSSTTESIYNYDINFNLGGPVIKDKIWFFLSTGYYPTKSRMFGFSEDITTWRITPLGKLTIQPGPRHRINLSFNFNHTRQPYMYASRYRLPEACYDRTTQAFNYNLNYLFTASPNTVLEVGASYLYRPTDYLSRSQSVYYYDLVTSIYSGSSNDCLQERLRWQAKATLTQFVDDLAGDHEFKAGVEYERGESRNASNWFPDEYGMAMYYMQNGVPYMAISYDPPRSEAQIDPYDQYAMFVQDSWRISRFFNLNIGFRYNIVDAYTPPQMQQTVKVPVVDWKTFEPRIALGIDPFGDGKTGIKLSYSQNATMMWTWFYSLNPNGAASTTYLVLGPGQFYEYYTSQPDAVELDPDLKRPYVEEIFFSIDRTIGTDFVIKASYVDRSFKNFVTSIDSAVTPEWYSPVQVTNPLNNQTITLYELSLDAPDPVTYYNNDPRAKRHYRAFILDLQKRMSHNFSFRVNYTWSQTKGTTATSSGMMADADWNDPNSEMLYPDTILSGGEHVIKFQAIYMAPLGIILSTNYTGQSGYPYGYYFQVSLNQGTLGVPAEDPDARRTPFIHDWNLRVAKDFHINRFNLSLIAEISNPLNLNTASSLYSQLGNPYYELDQIMGIIAPRTATLGVRMTF